MRSISSFFSSDGDLHQVVRNGSALSDTSTGRSAFVVSESDGFAIVSDSQGGMHNLIRTGSITYDTSTGRSWFEI